MLRVPYRAYWTLLCLVVYAVGAPERIPDREGDSTTVLSDPQRAEPDDTIKRIWAPVLVLI